MSITESEAAHRAVDAMFVGGDAELRQIATDLAELGTRMDGLGKEISAALGRLSWHGTASDAFVSHAGKRVRELSGVADDLGDLSKSVDRLADAC